MNPINTGVDDPSSHPKPLSQRAKETGASAAEKLKGSARHGAQEAKTRLSEQFESSANAQKAQVADRIEGVAGVVERVAHELREQEPWLGKPMALAAERARRASKHLRERQLDELGQEVRSWSNHPPLFLGGAFVMGLAFGRFIKGSQRRTQAETARYWEERDIEAQPPLPGIEGDVAASVDTAPGIGTVAPVVEPERDPQAVRPGVAGPPIEEERR